MERFYRFTCDVKVVGSHEEFEKRARFGIVMPQLKIDGLPEADFTVYLSNEGLRALPDTTPAPQQGEI